MTPIELDPKSGRASVGRKFAASFLESGDRAARGALLRAVSESNSLY